MYKIVLKSLYCSLLTLFALSAAAAQAATMALQVLGSGGPNDVGGRASSSYLVYLDGQSKIMIDAGGGASLRFGEASEEEKGGADIEDLELIAISHLHVDHSADLTTMLKRGYTWPPESYLSFQVFGPSGNEGDGYAHPDIASFLDSFLNKESGAYRYMRVCSGYPEIDVHIIDINDTTKPQIIYENKDYILSALSVGHANIPNLAYRVDAKKGNGGSIAFGSDQNASRQKEFTDFVQGVDILVMHLPNEERDPDQTFWHANPSTIGEVARDAGVKQLVLSHFMRGSLDNIEASREIIEAIYTTGEIALAEDLDIYPV